MEGENYASIPQSTSVRHFADCGVFSLGICSRSGASGGEYVAASLEYHSFCRIASFGSPRAFGEWPVVAEE